MRHCWKYVVIFLLVQAGSLGEPLYCSLKEEASISLTGLRWRGGMGDRVDMRGGGEGGGGVSGVGQMP